MTSVNQRTYDAQKNMMTRVCIWATHVTMEAESPVCSIFTGSPCSSNGASTLNAHRMDAQKINIDESAKVRPGHIL